MTDRVMAVLADHLPVDGMSGAFCSCGWKRDGVGYPAYQWAEHVAAELATTRFDDENGLGCSGCGLPYDDDMGWCDAVIPDEIWAQISPREDGGGVLCLTCMAKALTGKGLRDVPLAVTSGPWRFHSGGSAHMPTDCTALMNQMIETLRKLPQYEIDGIICVPWQTVWMMLNQRLLEESP